MREAVLLELALVQWVHGAARRARASRPVVPPVLVREQAMEEAGFFPTDRTQVYEVDDDELFLVGTSEVPLSALAPRRDPRRRRRSRAATPASRRASGARPAPTARTRAASSASTSSTRSRCSRTPTPTTSWDEHERILAIEESIVGGLGLPYRVVNIAAGDLGAAAAKKYDIEVWLPSEGRVPRAHVVLELPRLLGPPARHARQGRGAATELVHTLNGTACAIGRTLVFLFEHYQDADGGFTVPDVLRPYTGFDRVEPRK